MLETIEFIKNRIKRIVKPVWIYLTLVFVVKALLGRVHSFSYYLFSYLLTTHGTAGVWIMMIYILSAFLIPVFNKIIQDA